MKRLIPFLFYIAILCPSALVAAVDGWVAASKAIIYDDYKTMNPIGFLTEGTPIRVGEISRGEDQLLPIALDDKIGYIKLTDITTSLVGQKHREKYFKGQEKSYNTFRLYGVYKVADLGSDWDALSVRAGESAKLMNFVGAGLAVRPIKYYYYISAELLYGAASQESLRLLMWKFPIKYHYILLSLKEFITIETYLEAHLIPSVVLQIKGANNDYSGAGFGGAIGAKGCIKFFPHLSAFATIGLYRSKIDGLDTGLPVPVGYGGGGFRMLGGTEFALGVNYQF